MSDPKQYFRGRVTCLQIYGIALTANQIQSVKTKCAAGDSKWFHVIQKYLASNLPFLTSTMLNNSIFQRKILVLPVLAKMEGAALWTRKIKPAIDVAANQGTVDIDVTVTIIRLNVFFNLIQFDLEPSSGETMAFSFHIIPNKIDHFPFETSTRIFPWMERERKKFIWVQRTTNR